MKKRILLIDNEDISTTLDSIIEEAEDDKDLEYEVEYLPWFNPVDRQFYIDGDYDFQLARRHLIENYLDKKIDAIGCDFNLHPSNKTLTYEIIEIIRKFNKTVSVFIYSGGMNRSTLQMFGDEGKKPAEKYIGIAMNSNICSYINNRSVIPEKVIEILKNPSIELQVEDFLCKNGTLLLSHSIKTFQGKQLFEISKEVRQQTGDGKMFTKEVIERGLSHLIDLNSYS